MCPIHIRAEWELQDLGNNVPATNQEINRVSHGENSCRKRDTKTFFSRPKTELLRIFHFGMIQVVCCSYLRRF